MKILLYTNILTPYRKYLYDIMYNEFIKRGDIFKVFVMSDTEPDRHWKYEEYKTDYTILLKHKDFSYKKIYIHYNPELKEKIYEFKPNIIICGGSYLSPGLLQILLLKRKLKCKVLFWSESHFAVKRNYNFLKIFIREKIRKFLYSKFDGFICPGSLSKQFVDKYKNKKNNIVLLLPNIVNEEIFSKNYLNHSLNIQQIKNKYKLPLDKLILFSPIRLSKVKGMGNFLDAINLSDLKKDICIVIAGDGELKKELEIKAKNYDINIKLLGYRNQAEICDLYFCCDIFLLPSLSDPNPLSCIEALWSRKPLFISDCCGNHFEVIDEGENGYCFSYDKDNDLLAKFELMISNIKNKDWKEKAHKKSFQIAQEKFDSIKSVNSFIEQIHNL